MLLLLPQCKSGYTLDVVINLIIYMNINVDAVCVTVLISLNVCPEHLTLLIHTLTDTVYQLSTYIRCIFFNRTEKNILLKVNFCI